MKESISDSLILWETAKKENNYKEQFVHLIECWYPGNISIDEVKEVIIVEFNPIVQTNEKPKIFEWASLLARKRNQI